MVKSGSKFLYGLAAFGFVAAIVYSASTGDQELGMDSLLGPLTFGYKGYVGDHVGYAILMGLAIVSLVLGVFMSGLHDADPEAEAQVAGLETVPEPAVPATVNYWPIVGGFSAAALVLGLAVDSALFVVGMVGLAVVTVEWAVRTWSDRATGDPEVNRDIRNRFMYPVEIPIGAVLIIGGLVLAVSRILLAVPLAGAYVVFGLVPAIILGLGALIVLRPQVSQSAIAAILLVGGLAILGGGVAAAIVGEREHGGDHSEEGGHADEEGLAPVSAEPPLVITVGN
ncbi:MAG: hypothetical protein KDA98_00205 [Acidimicrobiales bacterium]|nr:hypothetical protein [Acidimicrobiales bacterium]